METSQCLKKIRPEDFSELLRDINPCVLDVQETLSTIKDIHLKYITVKEHNIKEKGILKVAREKRQITYKGITGNGSLINSNIENYKTVLILSSKRHLRSKLFSKI